MSTPANPRSHDLTLDHVRFHVRDASATAVELTDSYGMAILALSSSEENDGEHHSIALGFGDSTIVLTQALAEEHPANEFVQRHADGVSDIALSVADAAETFRNATAAGARPVREPHDDGYFITATIGGFGDVLHTLVQSKHDTGQERLPGFARPMSRRTGYGESDLTGIDHFAVCLEAGQLQSTVELYESILGFHPVFTERIEVGNQAMDSTAVQSPSGTVTFTLLEPITDAEAGQIDDFLKDHGGPGVQHIALNASDIVKSVRQLRSRGVRFLATPGTYYDQLASRVDVHKHHVDELRAESVLADEDHDGQLFQIFSTSRHPRNTFFFEIIERMGARTFGSGNVRALYAAVEHDRTSAEG